MAQARGQLGELKEVAYWREWERVDPDLGGGHQGTAVLVCGHIKRVRATRQNRANGHKRVKDDLGRPLYCPCLDCRIARES